MQRNCIYATIFQRSPRALPVIQSMIPLRGNVLVPCSDSGLARGKPGITRRIFGGPVLMCEGQRKRVVQLIWKGSWSVPAFHAGDLFE